ncbi:MAG: molybdopterin-dependent oxidoreductase [Anaerolineae bacterium]|nr:molybdopterin-dependent oxidoreductase [Anaerolineae bacterium]
MSKGRQTNLLTRLNDASVSRRSFLKWSAAAGATAALASKVDLVDGIYPLTKVMAAGEVQVIPTGCAHNCGGRCVLKCHVQDGVVVRITTDTDRPDDPNDPALIACMRGRAYRRRLYAPTRLKTPLRRVGPRGSGRFEEISWEEALDTVANEMIRIKEQYGNSALYTHYASGSYTEMTGATANRRLMNMFGGVLGYYNSYSTACTRPATLAFYGTTATSPHRWDWQNTKLFILWAWNPAEMIHGTNTAYMVRLARKAGAKTIVIDPRLSMSAVGLADEWIPIRPGTDCAMMAAMAYVMITEGLIDEDWVNKYAVGYDAQHMPEGYENAESFKAYILGESDGVPKTPAWAESITAVPADTITRIAREYATMKPAVMFQGWGPQRRAYGEQPVRFNCALATLTGNIGIPGSFAGGVGSPMAGEFAPAPGFSIPPNPVPYSFPVHSWTDVILRGKEMGRKDGIRGLAEGEETLPNSIKFLFNPAGNTLVNQHSNINRTIEILKDESLCEFIVTVDHFMTPSARMSDIVLPVCTFMETWGHCSNWTFSPSRILMPKVVDPLYDLPSDYKLNAMLAERLGIYDEFTEGGKTEEDWYNQFIDGMISEYGAIYGDRDSFVARGSMTIPYNPDTPLPFADYIADPEANPLKTPTGKIEIFSVDMARFNETIGDPTQSPPIPKYIQEWESPFGPEAEEYPLQAMGHHYMRRTHSTWDNIDWMEEALPQRVFMNPIDAEARGIKDGDNVKVWNQRGAMILPVRVTPRIMPGLVDIPQGGWYTPDANGIDRRGSINVLTNERPTPYAFGNPQHSIMVQVEKA